MFVKNNSIIIIDIGSKLTLLNVELSGKIKVKALKVIDFNPSQAATNSKDGFIVNSLQGFLKENNIRHRNAIVKLSLNSLFIKRFQLPAVPDKELTEAIRWQIKEDIPYDLSTAVLDYSIVRRTTKEDGSKLIDVISAVAKEEEVKRWVVLLKQAGLSCSAVGLLPFGYEKLMQRYFKEGKDKAKGILHIDDDKGYIFIYHENKLDFYRELPISINKFRESLGIALVSDKGKIELSSDEVEDILFNVGIPGDNFVYKGKLGAAQILGMLRPLLERLAMEIKRSFIYYNSQFKTGEVASMLISGPFVKMPKVETFLSKELGLIVKRISLEDKIEFTPGLEISNQPKVTECLSLAIDYKQGINLLPFEFRTEKRETAQKTSIRWLVFIIILFFITSFVLARASIQSYQARLDNARLYLNVLSEVKDTKDKIDGLSNFIKDLKGSEYPLAGMFKKLSNIAPRELFILVFSLDNLSKNGTMNGYVKGSNTNASTILTKLIN
ncbi:MAG: pilus assembly protein PilM, partial [Candidatus Omnitrophica bacterium]|nr:pilus assembly protein PilM [Candidatus Omnitrophota bacterium]